MASTYKRFHPRKWAGVYVYENNDTFRGKPDLCFYISYRNDKRVVWEKIGRISEGYSAAVASEIRAERVKAVRHGEAVKTAKEIRLEKLEKDKPFQELAELYFATKGPQLKGFTTDINRYQKHLLPLFGKKAVYEITTQMVEELHTKFAEHKPATLWNVLELFRRIVNFGHKTNRCPQLGFHVAMPVKDNERIEYLKPEEAQSFLLVLQEWPARDVAHMLMLAFFTGMRRGEIFKLEDQDIDWHMKLIHLRDPKGGKSVSIGMSSVAEDILRDQVRWRDRFFPDSPYLFPGKYGGLRKDCSAVDRIKKAAGLPTDFRPFHGLRHHFAVTLANSGHFTSDMIAEMLTHKNAAFTKKKYGQFLPESMTAAGNVAAGILLGKTVS